MCVHMSKPEEVGQLSRDFLDQWNRAILALFLRSFLTQKFAQRTEILKFWVFLFKFDVLFLRILVE